VPARSPDLAARADSLAALDPAREVRAALARGDRRFVGVCGYACLAPGVDYKAPGAPRAGQLRLIAGTSDAILNPDVERLNAVAYRYAKRYNTLLIAHLRKRRARARPAT
jgi:hypothetical protein